MRHVVFGTCRALSPPSRLGTLKLGTPRLYTYMYMYTYIYIYVCICMYTNTSVLVFLLHSFYFPTLLPLRLRLVSWLAKHSRTGCEVGFKEPLVFPCLGPNTESYKVRQAVLAVAFAVSKDHVKIRILQIPWLLDSPYIEPWNKNVGPLCLCGLLGPHV